MPTKKLIKEFVRCIQKHDYVQAKSLLDANPDLVHVTLKAPPAKYDGQSLLQIACRNAAAPIIEDLVNRGADVNFVETSEINEWTSPVIHDAVNMAVWSTLEEPDEFIERMIAAVELLLKKGADPNRPDSLGDTPLRRFLDNARKRVGDVYFEQTYSRRNVQLRYLKQVHDLLLSYGAEPIYHKDDGSSILTETEQVRIGID